MRQAERNQAGLVGWRPAASAISNAIALRSPAGPILHSDGGSQLGKKVRRLLDNNDLVGSMGRVGAACDNAATESFFSLLQKNVLDTPPLGDRMIN